VSRVTIARVAAGGEGVGKLPDGLVVFVPRSAPGDEVEIEVTERRRRYARGRVVRLLQPGPARVEPRCPHYERDRCGGCQWQHLSLEAQLVAKRAIVGDALRRIGHLEIEDPEIVPAPSAWRYRAKLTLHAAGGRLGLHPYDEPARVFDLEDCHIARPRLMQVWAAMRPHRGLLPRSLTELVLREDHEGGVHLVVGAGAEPWDAGPLNAALAGEAASLWWQPAGGAARVVAGARTGFPALAFQQSNPELAQRIRREAVEGLGEVAGTVIWDLYCGVGDASRLLAARGARVFGVDADPSAIRWARQHGGREEAITFLEGRVEETLHRLPEPHCVLANPPRVGLAPRVSAALEAWGARHPGARIAYMSCDPATLARDLARLPSFRVERLMAYDLFPQTSHVEVLAVLLARS
jgi:23S rRNA (uracil1939-C5)-methyltransferase